MRTYLILLVISLILLSDLQGVDAKSSRSKKNSKKDKEA